MLNHEDPRVALTEFLRSIPHSLRIDEYLFIILMCLGEQPPEDLDAFEPIIEKYLYRTGYAGFGAVICTKTILDRRLSGVMLKLERAEESLRMLTNSNPDFSPHPLLSMPLKKRQYAQVLERWKALSRGALSDENLLYFEQNPQALQPVTTA
ncbi:hypothetical protein LU631_21305 [Erwinia tracheiphila]|uniref:Uncharacterized protein n=1 Tax=Erwinia tracheiphila TaxID=65700 RepID=A0A0M2K991_9GAMM|nr:MULTISPECIES: hypothetical protein [Erwinia]ADP12360.1 hypothetical protein EJP617_26790 [Erwinia sp. Ejp617]EOS93833.1 hypothetical protein ETR_16947 [Erwinia tracheiphila PSU-1]KKF35940.1 hypothetical protein SY86_11715 [Erwinia tracheiphila]PIJ49250.1 hypothetical protein BV501_13655 [Erwinia sp. OAMSP11]PIJ70532.1 hypothetical protein BK416_13290 [Erwinia sp. OLSSP12]